MNRNEVSVVILGAGKGTRMKSKLPKVLHKIAYNPIICHVLHTVFALPTLKNIVLVTGKDMEDLKQTVRAQPTPPHVALDIVDQMKRLGTGDAVKSALPKLKGFEGTTLVLLGDVPLIQTSTLQTMLDKFSHTDDVQVSVLGFRAANPDHYGRLMVNIMGELEAIIEHNDATEDERHNNLCNSGIIAINNAVLEELLSEIRNDNVKGEYYLTDIVSIARKKGYKCNFSLADEHEVMGINSREQLAEAEAILQKRLRKKAMREGATLIEPESVFLSTDTIIGQDVVIHPNVVIGAGVTIGDHVEIKPFTHIEGAILNDNVSIGPFARIRPGSVIESDSHVGNFVEIKNSTLHEGVKVGHLSYIGDAQIGQRTNIGAGTITCNYDGFGKYQTIIGDDCFIGSHASLVAPVKIGNGAIVGAGSTITYDIGEEDLSLARAEQTTLEKKARNYREKRDKKPKQA